MTEQTKISIQAEDFDLNAVYDSLHHDNLGDGATATFCGRVRNNNLSKDVVGLYLEHYPGMTEKQLERVIASARAKWQIGNVTVIHRIGQLKVGEQIVFVGVTSVHRQNAFLACEFIMDHLKVKATFWKKELTADGDNHWLAAKASDHKKAQTW